MNPAPVDFRVPVVPLSPWCDFVPEDHPIFIAWTEEGEPKTYAKAYTNNELQWECDIAWAIKYYPGWTPLLQVRLPVPEYQGDAITIRDISEVEIWDTQEESNEAHTE